MRVRVDHAFDALCFRQRPPAPVQVKPLGRSVDFNPRARGRGGLQDGRDVDGIRLSREQHPPGRMTKDGDERILHRANDAPRHLRFRQAENGMHGSHRVIQFSQNLVTEIERAVAQDVALHSGEQAEALELPVQFSDGRALRAQFRRIQSVRLNGAAAVIGDP